MTIGNIRTTTAGAALAALLAVMMLAIPAWSAAPTAPIFPPGSHIGLVPPPGMVASSAFPGFVDPTKNAGIVISSLPGNAYADMEKTLTPDALKQRGITLEKRETLQLNIGKGDLVIGTQLGPDKMPYRKWLLLIPTNGLTVAVSVQAPASATAYSDAVVRAALSSIVLRAQVPQAEYLKLLPFTVGDLSGFQIANVIPGRALLLIDMPKDPHMVVTQGGLPEFEFNARSIIAAVPSAPTDPTARAALARDAFGTIGGIKDVHFTMSEPVRIENQEGFETVASADDVATGSKVMVVQWLRFGAGASLQMVGISRAAIWDNELSRLRAMRDSIQFK